MSQDNSNRDAVASLLTDAEQVLALTQFEDVRGNREMAQQTIGRARSAYDDLVRRGRLLTMTPEERTALQHTLDRLRAVLRFFGEAV